MAIKEVKNVPTSYGWLTEIWRADWALDAKGADQVFISELGRGQLSGWHVHMKTWDRLSATRGLLKIVLYDAREGGATFGMVNEFVVGPIRPGTLVIPPGVWHGVINVNDEASGLVNVVSAAYSYDAPDHHRLPPDTEKIPFNLLAEARRLQASPAGLWGRENEAKNGKSLMLTAPRELDI